MTDNSACSTGQPLRGSMMWPNRRPSASKYCRYEPLVMTAVRVPGGIRSAGPACAAAGVLDADAPCGAVRLRSARHDLAADLGEIRRAAVLLEQRPRAGRPCSLGRCSPCRPRASATLLRTCVASSSSSLSRPTLARAASMAAGVGTAGASPSKPHARTSGRTVGIEAAVARLVDALRKVEQRDELARQLERLRAMRRR